MPRGGHLFLEGASHSRSLILMNSSGMGAAKFWEGFSEGMNLRLDGLGSCTALGASPVEVESCSFSQALDRSLEEISRGQPVLGNLLGLFLLLFR